MPVNTVSVATAVTPTVVSTYISHYLNRSPLRQKPTAHITYHEGLELIRRFLHYASFHTVEEIQAFTSQWVPVPTWVHVRVVEIPSTTLSKSAGYINAQLGEEGVRQVGGGVWWQWRREGMGAGCKAEWIEMRKDYEERKRVGGTEVKGQRIMLYVHGGAYYFGSVDEHRYQMQRHARKLKARVLAPRYRLAPQFPFPCGLVDCLAAYLYLLEEGHDPSTILLAGDSAGGGMVVSILVTLRDQGVPLPAGAMLISPWVDLTHSFPSLGGDGKMDYIPAHGFVHKPSMSWPPPNADDLLACEKKSGSSQPKEGRSPRMSRSRPSKEEREAEKEERKDRVRGFSIKSDQPDADGLLKPPGGDPENPDVFVSHDGTYTIGPKSVLSVKLDGSIIQIKDQIQMYAANHLIMHPLVSPALQPTLGGLPPLLIQVGGGELLRDEQIYLAHKAASPLSYLPPPSNHLTAEQIQAEAYRYRPTNVQLQVWDDLCHVAPTLSFTRPAKYMYRSIAQFGAWALARAQRTSIDILDDDSVSFISSGGSSTSSASSPSSSTNTDTLSPDEIKLAMPQSASHVGFESIRDKPKSGESKPAVGKAGDPLPPFEKHMIRQRIDRHGGIHALAPPSSLPALNLPISSIGVPKPGPVGKWMDAQGKWNGKFAKQKLKIQKKRLKDLEKGFEGFEGESPPPTALAGRRVKGMKGESKKKKSWGMAMWSGWGSRHDEMTLDREAMADASPTAADPTSSVTEPSDPNLDGTLASPPPNHPDVKPEPPPKSRYRRSTRSSTLHPQTAKDKGKSKSKSRSRSYSRHSTVTDKGQARGSKEDFENAGLGQSPAKGAGQRSASPFPSPLPIPTITAANSEPGTPTIMIHGTEGEEQDTETVIPHTDTLSTRPTRGGVAYPFRLRVDGAEEGEVNASTLTLQSFADLDGEAGEGEGVGPSEAMTEREIETRRGEERSADGDGDGSRGGEERVVGERPGVERWVTAAPGELMAGKGGLTEKLERPGVERFETARESL
ncbi:hypothetical protein BCR34DRAFT_591033 [Clohesyomyces aquaticus]|uniref:Alpha/beta hydrolase fold-3 domain-containing protein n=1 Tax=Clohesyomyces aquaticus TaxID=1231657 RepID=A0A1Y1Z3U4_9PLEO|nr:hypothetical protein BCR34DRAFT_591033 [Clohesyomyces aquaticus]